MANPHPLQRLRGIRNDLPHPNAGHEHRANARIGDVMNRGRRGRRLALGPDAQRHHDVIHGRNGTRPTRQSAAKELNDHLIKNVLKGGPQTRGGSKQGKAKDGKGEKKPQLKTQGFVVSTGDEPFIPINGKVAEGQDAENNPNERPEPEAYGLYDPRIANPDKTAEGNEFHEGEFEPGEPPAEEELSPEEVQEMLNKKLEESRKKAGDALMFPPLPVFPAPYVQVSLAFLAHSVY